VYSRLLGVYLRLISLFSFLDEIHRIVEPDYLPTTGDVVDYSPLLFLTSMLDDILHVRLQTLGVTEHSFDINFAGTHYTWILYDVGGAVSFRYS
jgi:hypothetical protein